MTSVTKYEGARGTQIFSAPVTRDQGKYILLAASRSMPLIAGLPEITVYNDDYAYTSSCRTCFAGSLRALAHTAKELTRWNRMNEDRLSDTALADIGASMLVMRDLLMAAVQDEG